jgi:hypothetical protein
VAPRAKDTRERMVKRFKDGTFVYPGALFRLTPEELAAAERPQGRRPGWVSPETDGGGEGEGGEDDGTEPEDGGEDEADTGLDNDDPAEREAA